MNKTTALLALLAALSCASAGPRGGQGDATGGTMLVGVARVDITPEEPIRLSGYGDRRTPTDSVAQRLSAKALAIGGDAEGPSLLISAELVGVPGHLTERLAERLRGAGIRREQLVVTVTHTHNGPSLSGVLPNIFGEAIPPHEQAAIDRYTDELVARLERVALAALADRRPARVAWGKGSADIAANRRVLRDGRWTGFGENPAGPEDHDLPVLRVTDPDGRLRAILLGYAAHCTTLEGKHNFIHGDWAGVAQQLLEERHPGALALVTIGAGADINPSPRGGGTQDVARNATVIADEVDRVLRTPLRPLEEAPRGHFRSMALSFERVPSREDLVARSTRPGAEGLHARSMLARLDRGERLPATAAYPVQSWSWGDDLAMLFLGGEVVVDYGLRLKRELDASRLWVTAYANDVSFYVASRRVMAEGGYEVDGSMVYYGQPSRLAPDTEDRIIRAVHELLAGFRSALLQSSAPAKIAAAPIAR